MIPIHVALKRSSECTLASTNPCSSHYNIIHPLVAVCCSVLQCVAVSCIHEPLLKSLRHFPSTSCSELQCVAMCCNALRPRILAQRYNIIPQLIISSLHCYGAFLSEREYCALSIRMYVCTNASTYTHTHTYITNKDTRACTQI